MVTLKNSSLTAVIAEQGAELKSLRCGETEYIWEGKKEVWAGSCPVLFPICGGLKEDRYLLNGKNYELQKHGFARFELFEVEEQTAEKAVFLHRATPTTKQHFPFDYELRIIYTLTEKQLKIDYAVQNLSAETMYFNIGSHEGFYTPEGIEDYDIVFPTKETLNSSVLYGNLLSDHMLPILKNSNVLPLYEKYFTIDALVFKNLKSRSATLRNRKTGRAVQVNFPDAPYFLLWHKPGAPYMCLEPWNGLPDFVDSGFNIAEKAGITALPAGEEFFCTHSITVKDEEVC